MLKNEPNINKIYKCIMPKAVFYKINENTHYDNVGIGDLIMFKFSRILKERYTIIIYDIFNISKNINQSADMFRPLPDQLNLEYFEKEAFDNWKYFFVEI